MKVAKADFAVDLEIDIEAPWPAGEWEELSQRCTDAAGKVAPEIDNERLSTSLIFTSDKEIHALNKQWRERDKPTNVLSFPMLERADVLALAPDGPPDMLGDIALSFETCAREAEEKAISLQDHTAHLIIHGLLHLAGYDHEISEDDAEEMEKLEINALALMGINNPY